MKEWGAFSCKEWGFQNGFLILKDISILNSAGYQLKVEKGEFKGKNYFLDGVDLCLKEKIDFSQFLKTTDCNIVVKNGLLSFNGDEKKIPWELNKNEKRASLTLFFASKPVKIVMEKNIITTSFDDLCAKTLFGGLKCYFDWDILEGKVASQNLQFDLNEKKLSGALTVHQLKAKNEKLFINLHLEEGYADFDGGNLAVHFKNLKTNLDHHDEIDLKIAESAFIMKGGKILPCEIEATLMGLKGKIVKDINGVNIDFEGENLTQFFPNDFIGLHSRISTHPAGVDFKGSILVGTNSLDFGGHVGQSKIGWFKGKGFALEKFLNPFLLKNTKLNLSGFIDIEGTIEPEGLTLYYLGKDISLENDQFCLKCPNIGPDFNGFHYLDFKEKRSFGNFALKKGTYIQKNYGFTLENASAQVLFHDQNIELKSIVTHYQDLDLKGDVIIDLHKEGPAKLFISAPQFEGSLASAKNLLNHFVPSFFWSFPLEGRVSSEKGGLFFHFILGQKTHLAEAQICGKLQGQYLGKFFSLNDYTTTFDYDKSRNKILFDEGVGILSVKGIDYKIRTQKLDFSPLAHPSVEVDIIAEKGREVFQIQGKMHESVLCLGGNLIDLKGKIQERCLQIESFICKGFQGCAEFDFDKGLSYIEIASKEMGKIKFDGTFDKNWIDGDVTFDDLCLSKVLKSYEKLWNPKGKITGNAKFHWNFQDQNFELAALSNFEDLSVAGIEFGKGANLQCMLSSEHGLIVEGLEVAMNDDAGRYKLGKLHYNEGSQKIKFDELAFSFPKEKITYVTAFLKKLMPDKVTDEMIFWIESLKKEGELEGKVSMEVEPDRIFVHLALKDGRYFFQGKEHEVANFLLTMTPHHVEVNTDYIFKGLPFFLSFHSDPLFTKGMLRIKENRLAKESLLINWRKTSSFHLEEIKGKFLGLIVNLKENTDSVLENLMAFKGKVEVDWGKCGPLFSEKIFSFIQKLGFGSGYSLEGDFIFSPHDIANLIFSGRLYGSSFQLGNLCLKSLKAEVLYTSKLLEIKNLSIEDGEGSLSCPLAEFKEIDQRWMASIPKLRLSHFRLFRLKTEIQKEKKGFFKPTTIQSFNLCDFKGILGERKSFEGFGEVEFSHVSRKSFFSTLLFLPTEITARLGLDLNLLVPSRGKIRYKIEDAKINLLQFRSMYSEGKRSRFYLAEGQPAYIDFDGNMNMKIKMKQYNLLMKVAEFFVISVKGTVKQPAISFTNLFEANFDEDQE